MITPRLFPCLLAALIGLVGLTQVGCETTQTELPSLDQANARFASGDYSGAFSDARLIERGAQPPAQHQAAYLAGMSQWRLGQPEDAARWLEKATRTSDQGLRADANASLGLIYSELEQYALAADRLRAAAPYYEGQEQAQAYFYAGVALQKLDRRPEARTTLLLARAASPDPAFRQQVDNQIAVTGYTLQFGAYLESTNAQERAEALAPRVIDARIGAPRLVSARDAQGRSVTLVQAGQFHSYRSAQQARDRIGDTSVFIVQLGDR